MSDAVPTLIFFRGMPVSSRVERMREGRVHSHSQAIAQMMLGMLSTKRINTYLAIKVN